MARERNHPPSQKCIPSWKTTRVKVCVPETGYPIQASEAELAPSQLSYCRQAWPDPTAGLSPSRIRETGPPLPRGFGTRAMMLVASDVTTVSAVAVGIANPRAIELTR